MPMAKGAKRAAAAETFPAKRAHLGAKVEQKCGVVLKALAAAPASAALPEDVVQLLGAMLPLSLGEYQDQRHPYQNKIVDVVSGMLGDIETQFQSDAENAEAEVRDIEASKEMKASAVITAQEVLVSRESVSQEQKKALAEATISFRELRDALQQARASEAEVEARIESSATKLAATKAVSQDFVAPLKESSLPEPEVEAKLETLMSFLAKEVGLDESLLTALPAALGKATDTRGPFDLLAVQQLEHVMAERVDAISKEIEEGGPAKANCIASVSSAQASYVTAVTKLTEAAAAFRAARAEEENGAAIVANDKKAVKELSQARNRASRQLDRAGDRLSRFRDGVLLAFGELRDRGTQKQAEEQVEAKEADDGTDQQCATDNKEAEDDASFREVDNLDTDATASRVSEPGNTAEEHGATSMTVSPAPVTDGQ